MDGNVSPNPSHDLNDLLQKQVRKIIDRLRDEIKRINDHPNESSGNAQLYLSLAEEIEKVMEEVCNPDVINSLQISIDSLRMAEELAKNKQSNQEILINLQDANAELFASRNIRG
ncbi:MAG TPA: hypothetical protein VJ112_04340 [Rhabdochlamydiaceae bacterium]|nr:hypothetical protein [Rhabdochlamydiaceae bacterium]